MSGPDDSNDQPEPEWIALDELVMDLDLSPRVEMDDEAVDDFAEDMKRGDEFIPARAVRIDGVPHLIDGWHRLRAAERIGSRGLWVRVWTGTREQAIEWAAVCNAKHGVRRSAADKVKAATMLLGLPKWAQSSDAEIARHLRIRRDVVAAARAAILPNSSGCEQPIENIEGGFSPGRDRRVVRRGGQEYPMTMPRPRGAVRPIVEPIEEQRREAGRSTAWGVTKRIEAPRAVVYTDILGWLTTASDDWRRRLSDDAFSFIVSAEERLKHDETVRAWLAKHERGDASEPCDDAGPTDDNEPLARGW